MIRGLYRTAGALLAAWLFTEAAAVDGAALAQRCGAAPHSCHPRWYYLWTDFRQWMTK